MSWRFSSVCVLSLCLAACGTSPEGAARRGSEGRAHGTSVEDPARPPASATTGAVPSAPARRVEPASAGAEADGHSLRHLDAELALVDQRGARFTLGSLAGKPTLLTFFYSTCTTMCPLILSDVKRIVAALPVEERDSLHVVLLTIDPARDTAARLRAVAAERALPPSWSLVTGDASSIRTVAATVGMTYRPLPDGTFAHAALYTVLGPSGRVVHQLEGTGRSVEETAAVLSRLLGGAAP